MKAAQPGRERLSEELPDAASHDAGPNTLATRLELSNLIAEAAGGLSDRDRTVLDLTYRHGLDGPELATALGVSQSNANTLVYRLRDTVERSLGALLVSRRARTDPARCRPLAEILQGWDGRFTMLMRKRIVRHIESCQTCEHERRRLVNPAALLGAAPVLIPAPRWLRDKTMSEVQLTSAATGMPTQALRGGDTGSFAPTASFAPNVGPDQVPVEAGGGNGRLGRRVALLVALMIGVPLAILGVVFAWLRQPTTAVTPVDESVTSAPVVPPNLVAPTVRPPTSNPTGPQQPSNQQRISPRSSAASPPPGAGPGTNAPPTPPPAEATPPPGEVQAPPPASAPNQTIYAPPPPVSQAPPPDPQPNQLPPPPPPPDESAAEQELPPLIIQGPLPPVVADPTFVPPN